MQIWHRSREIQVVQASYVLQFSKTTKLPKLHIASQNINRVSEKVALMQLNYNS